MGLIDNMTLQPEAEALFKTALLFTQVSILYKNLLPPQAIDPKEDTVTLPTGGSQSYLHYQRICTRATCWIVFFVQVALMWVWPEKYPQMRRLARWELAGYALAIGGGLLRLWCFRELGRFFTFLVTIRLDHVLVQTGPYRYLVHPAYFAQHILGVGSVLASFSDNSVLSLIVPRVVRSRWGVLIFLALNIRGILGRIRLEEGVLRSEFGTAWDRHVAGRWRLVPFLW